MVTDTSVECSVATECASAAYCEYPFNMSCWTTVTLHWDSGWNVYIMCSEFSLILHN